MGELRLGNIARSSSNGDGYIRSRGAAVLTKCSNHSCSASFRSLNEGRLFRLETDPTLRTSQPKRIEYYWLCEHCASVMTLRLGDHDDVVAGTLPLPLQTVPKLVAVTLAQKKRGLLLQAVVPGLPKRGAAAYESAGESARSRIRQSGT